MHRSPGAIHSNQTQETIVPASLKRNSLNAPRKEKDLRKDEGTYSRRRKTWFEVAGVRVVTRLHEIFMVSPKESFPHEHEESLYGRDDGELRSLGIQPSGQIISLEHRVAFVSPKSAKDRGNWVSKCPFEHDRSIGTKVGRGMSRIAITIAGHNERCTCDCKWCASKKKRPLLSLARAPELRVRP